MNNFDPAIYNEAYENGHVDNRDFKPFVINNLITDSDVANVYKMVEDRPDNFLLQQFAGHKAWTLSNKDFENRLSKSVSDWLGEDVVLREYSFARYSNKFGYNPKLFPHYDTHKLDGQRVTVDIQLNKNVEWPVVVEGEPFVFDVKDALVFSGTQQVHWRSNLVLSDEDEVDMIFAHFAYVDQKPWSENQKEILEYWSHRLREQTGISNQPEPNNWLSV
jgi:hypothetical protein